MSCDDIRPYLEAFCDDELSPERTLVVQSHLRSCPSCQAEVDDSRAFVRATRTSCSGVGMCPDFGARLRQTLDEQCRLEEKGHAEEGRADETHGPEDELAAHRAAAHHHSKPLGWRAILPLSAAAAAVLSLGYVTSHESLLFAQDDVMTGRPLPLTQASTENLVDVLVQHHSRPSTPEVTDSGSVMHLEPELGFPVRAPNLERYGGHFLGANLIQVDGKPTASLHYNLSGRRVTFYVYNPDQLPLRATRALHPTVVGDRAVFVGHKSGYSIATCEREGIGYAVAADLTDRESAELVASVGR